MGPSAQMEQPLDCRDGGLLQRNEWERSLKRNWTGEYEGDEELLSSSLEDEGRCAESRHWPLDLSRQSSKSGKALC